MNSKSSLLIVFSSLLSLIVLGQEVEKEKKFSFGAAAHYGVILPTIDQAYIKHQFSYSAGISALLNIQLNSNLSIYSGISARILSRTYTDYRWTLACDFDPVVGFDTANSWAETNSSDVFVGIPLQLKYSLLKEGNSPYIRIGVEALIQTFNSNALILFECGNERDKVKIEPFSSPKSMLFLNTAIGYSISSKPIINVEVFGDFSPITQTFGLTTLEVDSRTAISGIALNMMF